MEKSTFEKIKEWSLMFGLPVREQEEMPNIEELAFCFKLIKEEFEELEAAVLQRNFTEIKDGACDVIWTAVRLLQTCGVDPQRVMDEVYESNMSKSDPDWDTAELSKNKYLRLGVVTYQREREYNGQKRICHYRQSDGKLLKSINFKEPKL